MLHGVYTEAAVPLLITLGRIHTQEISLQKKLEAQTKTQLLIKFLHFKGESQGFALTSVADHLVFPFFIGLSLIQPY